MPRDTKRDTRCRLTAMSAESAEEARVRIVAGRGLGGRRWMAFQTSYAGSIPVARSPPGVRQRVADHLEGAAVVVDVRWQAEGALDAWGVGDDGLLRDPHQPGDARVAAALRDQREDFARHAVTGRAVELH